MNPRTFLSILAAAFLLIAGPGIAQAGPQGPIPQNLDEMIAAALRANPEVVLAEAKLRQAQAELNQVRLQVTRDVVTAFAERKQHEGQLAAASQVLQQAQALQKRGTMSNTDVEKAKAELGQAEVASAQSDAAMRYLIGVGTQMSADPFRAKSSNQEPERAKTEARPQTPPDAMIGPLAKQVTGPFENTNLADLTKRLSDQIGVSILVDANAFGFPAEFAISLTLREPVTLTQVFQALADQHDMCFILRDYGILVTSEGRAMEIRAPAIPSNLRVNSDATK
jgi:hypothetical protein